MELVAWVWPIVQKSGPVVTVLLVVVLYGMDKLWQQRHLHLDERVSENKRGLEAMANRLHETKDQVDGLKVDVAKVVTTTKHIKETLERHDEDEREFWKETRRFMVHQGYNGGDDDSS
jgi:hypothetical protein